MKTYASELQDFSDLLQAAAQSRATRAAIVEKDYYLTRGKAWYRYRGLVPHDLRRSAVRNLVNSGVDTATAMKITGHRTLHIFMRYNIISTG